MTTESIVLMSVLVFGIFALVFGFLAYRADTAIQLAIDGRCPGCRRDLDDCRCTGATP